MGIVARLAEFIGHAFDQLFGDRMLEALGFDVHVTPVKAELAREIRLENAMAANHLECRATALWSELHAAIRDMLDQPGLGEALHHAAHRRRRDFEHFGDIARCGETALTREMKNGLQIVFNRSRERRLGLGRSDGIHRLSRNGHCQRDRALG
jgi:hypothetical protein